MFSSLCDSPFSIGDDFPRVLLSYLMDVPGDPGKKDVLDV
jgi:hypothetical protein